MDAGRLLLIILASAGVGALVASIITAMDRWRERTARERELLFRSAVEIAKATAERAAKQPEPFTPGQELLTIEKTQEILKEVYEKGKMSENNRGLLHQLVKLAKKKDGSGG